MASHRPHSDDTRRRRRRAFWSLSAIVLLATGISVAVNSGSASEDVTLDVDRGAIPRTYFGMHIHNVPWGVWPSVPFGTWRLWDANGAVWPEVEPQRGQWQFERLDKFVSMARERGVEVLLPLGLTPAWASARPQEPSAYKPGWAAEPRDLNDWRQYVRKVAQRYKGIVRHYEIWNEPNITRFYSGSIEQLVTLTRTAREELRSVDPDIVLVSPSYVDESGLKPLDEFLAKGGGRYVDVIGFHFYRISESPEGMLKMIARVRQIMKKHGVDDLPLWNTETGWIIANTRGKIDPVAVGFPAGTPMLSSDEAAAYVARSLILSWAAGVERVYWYAWDNKGMGLSEQNGRWVKPAGEAYRQAVRWLDGATIDFCRGTPKGIWTCRIERADGPSSWLVWTTTRERRWPLPESWEADAWEGLDTRRVKLEPGAKELPVSHLPIRVTSKLIHQAHREPGQEGESQ